MRKWNLPGKKLRLTEKHKQFLKLVTTGALTIGECYLEAGFNSASKENAASCGSVLLKKINESPDFLEIINAFNPTHEMAQDYAELRRSMNPMAKLGSLSQLAKIKKWIDDSPPAQFGFQVIIGSRDSEAVTDGKEQPTALPITKKPTSLLR